MELAIEREVFAIFEKPFNCHKVLVILAINHVVRVRVRFKATGRTIASVFNLVADVYQVGYST